MVEEKHFEASWNLAEAIIFNIGSYLTNGSNHFLQGRLDNYFWCLVMVKRRIYAFINDKEKQEIDSLEAEIKKLISAKGRIKNTPSAEYVLFLESYDASIMQLLNKYRLLVPPRIDRTRLMG